MMRRHLNSNVSLKLGRVALVGLAVALSAVACSVGTSDDNEPPNGTPTGGMGGEGGDETGGTGGGASTGGNGSGGDGGANTGPAELDCAATPTGEPASTDPEINDEACNLCLKDKCASEFGACFATSPDAACGASSTSTFEGEAFCVLECIDALYESGDFTGGELDYDTCAADCASPSCDGATEPTDATRDLVLCLLGETTQDTGCQFECGYQCIGLEGCSEHTTQGACEADTANDCAWNAP